MSDNGEPGEAAAFIAAVKLVEDAGWIVQKPLATPSPIEDVAPSEAEIEAIARVLYRELHGAPAGDMSMPYGAGSKVGIAWRAARAVAGIAIELILAARRVRPSPVDEDDATAKRLADASDYSIQLQRIIEAICHDTPLREDSKTLHHYRMAEKFKAELDGTRTNLRHWREECGKLHAQEETLRSLLTYIREHDGDAPGDNPALCQQIDASLQSQRKG